MRVSAIVLALAISAPAPGAGPAPAQPAEEPALNQVAQQPPKPVNCPRTARYLAGRGSMYQGAPLTPKKLTELPPATAYMAVARTIDGCEVPLTMTEYRTGRRP